MSDAIVWRPRNGLCAQNKMAQASKPYLLRLPYHGNQYQMWEKNPTPLPPFSHLSLSLCKFWIQFLFKYKAPGLHINIHATTAPTQSTEVPIQLQPECALVNCDVRVVVSASHLPVVAFLAKLLLEVSQGEAVSLHHAAIRNLFTTEEVGDHEFLRPTIAKWKVELVHQLNSQE